MAPVLQAYHQAEPHPACYTRHLVSSMSCLRHVALRCEDIEKSRQFYERLGMDFVGYRQGNNSMDLTDGTLNMTLIQQPDGSTRPTLEEGSEYVHFGFIVEDAKESWNALKEFGAKFLCDDVKERRKICQEEPPPGSYKVEDPDGNIVDITDDSWEWRGVTL